VALPADLYPIVLTGTFLDAAGTAQAGRVTVTPSTTLTDATGKVAVYPQGRVYQLAAGTFTSDPLAPTDAATLSPAGWTYSVKVELQNAVPYSFSVLLAAAPFSFTATNATPAVFTAAGSAYASGTPVKLTGSSLPAGFTAGVIYYVVSPSGASFSLAATSGGSAIASTSTGSGTVSTGSADLSALQPVVTQGAPLQYSQLLTPTAVQTANYTAAAGQFVATDTTSGAVTVTLPNAPAAGTLIGVKMTGTNAAGTNATTIAAAGSDVFNKAGGGTTQTLALLNEAGVWQYNSGIWLKQSDDLPLAGTDARYARVAGVQNTSALVTQVPVIVFDGDSLTNGTGALPFNNFPASNDYPSQVAATLDPGGSYYNVGVGGELVSAMITNAPSVVDTKLAAGANNIVCFHGGTNDLASTDNATTTYNRIVTYCQARQAAGWKVIVSTLTPRSDVSAPGDFDTIRLALNANIRANWATFANALADIGADANMGTVGQETNNYYFNGDLLHHSPNGYQVLASYFLQALRKLGVTGHVQLDRQDLVSDLFIPASNWALSVGTTALGTAALWPCWAFHHGETGGIISGFILPRNWKTFAAQVVWSNSAGGSGNVAWRLDPMTLFAGSNLTSVTSGAQTNVAASTALIALVSSLTGASYTANQGGSPRVMQGFRLVRLGTSGSDTYASDAQFLGLYLYRAT
jgi:lysophospholipase L1-like esterase